MLGLCTRKTQDFDGKSKPQQVHASSKYAECMLKYLTTARAAKSGIDGILSLKCDGRSALVHIHRVGDAMHMHCDGHAEVKYRFSDIPVMTLSNMDKYLKERLPFAELILQAELTAMFVSPGRDPVELGHHMVPAAVATFLKNGQVNKDDESLHLWIRPFHIERMRKYVQDEWRSPSNPSIKYLHTLFTRQNVFYPVKTRDFNIRIQEGHGGRNDVVYRLDNKRVALDMEEFLTYAKSLAGEIGAEGWVLQIGEQYMDDGVAKMDAYKMHRYQPWLKIKDLFNFKSLLAVKACDEEKNPDRIMIWLYEKPVDKAMQAAQWVRYVGQAAPEGPIGNMLRHKAAVIILESNKQKKDFELIEFKRIMNGAITVSCWATGVTMNYLINGVKHMDAHQVKPVVDFSDYTGISTVKEVADKNPHFLNVKTHCTEYEKILAEKEPDRSENTAVSSRPAKKKQARPAFDAPPQKRPCNTPKEEVRLMPVETVSPNFLVFPDFSVQNVRKPSPARQHSPPRQHSPVRQHSPERSPSPCEASQRYSASPSPCEASQRYSASPSPCEASQRYSAPLSP